MRSIAVRRSGEASEFFEQNRMFSSKLHFSAAKARPCARRMHGILPAKKAESKKFPWREISERLCRTVGPAANA
jgi:hypothetical protein